MPVMPDCWIRDMARTKGGKYMVQTGVTLPKM